MIEQDLTPEGMRQRATLNDIVSWKDEKSQNMGSLFICIACHYSTERLSFLHKVLENFIYNYDCPIHIIIDTNSKELGIILSEQTLLNLDNVELIVHDDLKHAFHLTWQHRQHIAHNIDKYDNFMYIEDDMLLPWGNYVAYIEKFKLLWPSYVPGFVRIEEKDGEQYISDVPVQHTIQETDGIILSNLFRLGNRTFTTFDFPHSYHAFWIMPAKELKESMTDAFMVISEGREFNAMWTGWGLGKKPLVEIELVNDKWQIKKDCYSYHLPNNYALSEGMPNGKIKVQDILI